MEQKKETLLEIHNLSVSFTMYTHGLERRKLKVISDLYLDVKPGEIVAVAGSSGSGKSLLAEAILGILPENATVDGHLHYKGEELTKERQKELCGREIALVPQDLSYLDPLMKVGKQVDGKHKSALMEKKRKLFKRFGLKESTQNLYPFQLSGGMARRVLVCCALITEAELIIADEPTPGMSVYQALEALKELREIADSGKGVILITHDLDLAFEFADRVAVFYAGTTVEIAPSIDFKEGPEALRHPYSKALWYALPQNGFAAIPGFQPYCASLPEGCLFAPRCRYRSEECLKSVPPIREVRGGEVRCFHGA